MKKNIIAELLLNFMKIGLFTFGGGYAMISMIDNLCVEKKGWITHDDMMNITVISESTPGPIAINCATFVGSRQAGMAGAIAATFGIVRPSFIIIYAIAVFAGNFWQLPFLSNILGGIKIAVGFLIADAGLTMIKKMKKNKKSVSIMAFSFLTITAAKLLSVNISVITVMCLCAAFSLFTCIISGKNSGTEVKK